MTADEWIKIPRWLYDRLRDLVIQYAREDVERKSAYAIGLHRADRRGFEAGYRGLGPHMAETANPYTRPDYARAWSQGLTRGIGVRVAVRAKKKPPHPSLKQRVNRTISCPMDATVKRSRKST